MTQEHPDPLVQDKKVQFTHEELIALAELLKAVSPFLEEIFQPTEEIFQPAANHLFSTQVRVFYERIVLLFTLVGSSSDTFVLRYREQASSNETEKKAPAQESFIQAVARDQTTYLSSEELRALAQLLEMSFPMLTSLARVFLPFPAEAPDHQFLQLLRAVHNKVSVMLKLVRGPSDWFVLCLFRDETSREQLLAHASDEPFPF